MAADHVGDGGVGGLKFTELLDVVREAFPGVVEGQSHRGVPVDDPAEQYWDRYTKRDRIEQLHPQPQGV